MNSNERFWYKRMITRLDTGTLSQVVHGTADAIKRDPTPEEKVDEVVAERRSLQTKTESVVETERMGPADIKSNAWQKLMNLLIQLRKICNQYLPYFFSRSNR
jgi:SWI/SNF-related matrix-associated actin-dependent regulator of chromatin subfamily A member 5